MEIEELKQLRLNFNRLETMYKEALEENDNLKSDNAVQVIEMTEKLSLNMSYPRK